MSEDPAPIEFESVISSDNSKPRHPLALSALVHENLGKVMRYAYSAGPIEELMREHEGDWKYLRKALIDLPTADANKAIVELALFLRILDDEEKISAAFPKDFSCGVLVLHDGSESVLPLREVSNKILHSAAFNWNVGDGDHPTLICRAREGDRCNWAIAFVNLSHLATACGRLAS